jgi:predicted acyltransferase
MVVSPDHCSDAHVQASVSLGIFETERVNSVWAAEELGFAWITLNVLPSCVGPSAGNELKILFWVLVYFLILLFYEIS